MKLIDAPIGIFRFDGELVLKTEYCSENKLSGKYIPDCYIVRTGEYFWGGAKTANELNNLDVEPVDFAELLPTVTDTISRQHAIDAVNCVMIMKGIRSGKSIVAEAVESAKRIMTDNIRDLPPTQPERIIHCKDCKYGMLDSGFPHQRFCSFKGNEWNNDDHFCGHAKRREVTT